jgi:hypothetical protein
MDSSLIESVLVDGCPDGKTEFLGKNILWQQQYENYAVESEVTSGQRRDVQRVLKRASSFRQESCGCIVRGLGILLR